MERKSETIQRILLCLAGGAVVAAAIWGLMLLNERMTVRYQAVGVILDSDHKPLEGVEVVLLLNPPPPAGPALDALFRQEGMLHARQGTGKLKRAVGPPVGLSGHSGAYVVRALGRTGAARAIRLGLDSQGRPPFEIAWLVFRKQGFPDLTRTVSILGWRTAPGDWGTFANRLPSITMDRE